MTIHSLDVVLCQSVLCRQIRLLQSQHHLTRKIHSGHLSVSSLSLVPKPCRKRRVLSFLLCNLGMRLYLSRSVAYRLPIPREEWAGEGDWEFRTVPHALIWLCISCGRRNKWPSVHCLHKRELHVPRDFMGYHMPHQQTSNLFHYTNLQRLADLSRLKDSWHQPRSCPLQLNTMACEWANLCFWSPWTVEWKFTGEILCMCRQWIIKPLFLWLCGLGTMLALSYSFLVSRTKVTLAH